MIATEQYQVQQMEKHAPGADDRLRTQKIGDIADWYRGKVAYSENNRYGIGVSVTVDYSDRIIIAYSYIKNGHIPYRKVDPEYNMELDEDVLNHIHEGLKNKNNLVIIDLSDIPAYGGSGEHAQYCLASRIHVFDIYSGDEIGEPKVVTREKPRLPVALQSRLLTVAKTANNSDQRSFVAETFFHEFLRCCASANTTSSAAS